MALNGSLTGTGPLDALIEYVEPVVVNWQGSDIATLTLPKGRLDSVCRRLVFMYTSPVCAAANVGVPNYQTDAQLSITNHDAYVTLV